MLPYLYNKQVSGSLAPKIISRSSSKLAVYFKRVTIDLHKVLRCHLGLLLGADLDPLVSRRLVVQVLHFRSTTLREVQPRAIHRTIGLEVLSVQ